MGERGCPLPRKIFNLSVKRRVLVDYDVQKMWQSHVRVHSIISLSSAGVRPRVFTARRYASAVYVVVVCLYVSVRLSLCLSLSGIVSKWLNVGSRK